nr:ATP-binding cassette domain-containing protein [Propionibacterium sp.]
MSLRAQNVAVAIGGRTILPPVSLSCDPGRLTALIGPSGSGKTTLLHCLGLLQRPTAGRIIVDGEDATEWSGRRRRRFWAEDAGFVLQDYGLIDEDSVAANVTMRTSLLRGRPLGDADRVAEVLALTGLDGRQADPVVQLSGGEKQRLGVARALYRRSRFLFVDEPTASLDAENRRLISGLLRLACERGATVVVATHDEELATVADVTLALGTLPEEESA